LSLAAIPIIIHLLFRRRFRRIDWAPMHYLKLSIQRNRRRIRLEQLLLLALRTLIILLLFFMVARPVMHAAGLGGWLGGRSRTGQIVLIDDSLSMGHQDQGRSALERAQELAADVLKTVGPKDRFTLLQSSQADDPLLREVELAAGDDVAQLIAGLQVSDTFTSWEPVLEALDELIVSGTYPIHEVTVITDLRRAGWENRVASIGDRWAGREVRLRLFDVGSDKTTDLAVDDLLRVDRLSLIDTPLRWEAVIYNRASVDAAEQEAHFIVDGQSSLVRLPSIAAGQVARITLAATFQQAGLHHVALELPDDDLPGNNSRRDVVDVRDEMNLLLVDGEPSTDPLGGEVDYLKEALTSGLGGTPAFRAEVLPDSGWAALAGSRPDLLVLANLATINADEANMLERAVRGGTGLMVFLGEQVDPDAYNSLLYKGGAGLLPARLLAIVDETSNGLLVDDSASGPLDSLLQLSPAVLEGIRVRQTYEVVLPANETDDVRVLARWNDAQSSPAVLEKKFGAGRVLLWTVTADQQWSGWPTEPSYVLAVCEAAKAVARGEAHSRGLTAGEVLKRPLPAGREITNAEIELPGVPAPEKMSVERGDATGDSETNSLAALTFDKTHRAGLYKLVWQDAQSGAQDDLYFVNHDVRESDLSRIAAAEVEGSFGRLKPEVIPAFSGTDAPIAIRGKEIWRSLAVGLLCMLAAESCLATWTGRQR
jgi:hypothetical protein